MRIVAGTARGRALQGPGPKSTGIRPTADRVRESIFNVLGQWMDGLSVLDLFAGTGAFALEALSRGATRAVLVDSDKEAIRLCRENAQSLGFESQVEILPLPVAKALPRLSGTAPFDLIFADPPYAAQNVVELLEAVATHRLCKPGGRFLLEHDKRESVPESHGPWGRDDQRRFGDTVVSFYTLP